MGRFIRANPTTILSLWTLLLGCFNIAGIRPDRGVIADSLDMVKVTTVAGGDASLPCDTRSPQASDVLLLVVWYKNDVPLYSYDSRNTGLTAHWADNILGGRAKWHTNTPSSLRIRNVIPTDRAMYRCRVDFKISPTQNHRILLDVIEIPEKPKIFDEFDKEVVGVAGPYVEDGNMKLTCVVSGGKPMPRIRWWRDDKIIATLAPVDDGSRLSLLELRIPRLTREYFEVVYTCTADNTALVPPMRVNVQIQIYLRPLFVEILSREQPISVGQVADLACKAVGARPTAVITWWLNDIQIPADPIQKNSDDKNETISFLRWTPRMEHDGRVLKCRASHVKLEYTTIESSIILNLHYAPIVTLKLGSKLNPNDIEEGDDVYFECIVKSNPPAYKVVWEHNGQPMTHNQRAGVIAGLANLALQGVNRSQSGKYSCTASNVEGDGKSAPVSLQVIYKPTCSGTNPAIVGAAINEPTNVTCHVNAFPMPKSFQWTLNNSMGIFEIKADKFIIHENGISILSYTPVTEKDYGSLSCRAINLAGQQMEPCWYSLLPAVRPDQLRNCTSINLTDVSVEIRCEAGYDGGLQTSYFVEVWETKNLVANVSTNFPAWILRGLGSGKTLMLIFYAYNARGRSESTKMNISTLSRLVQFTEAKSRKAVGIDVSWILFISAGIASTLLAVVAIILLAKKTQQSSMQYEAPTNGVKVNKSSNKTTNHSPIYPDDKNPDVIPLGKDNKDFNSDRELVRPSDPPPYGSVVSPSVNSSRSSHSIHHDDMRPLTPRTPKTPSFDTYDVGTLVGDRRTAPNGTFSRRREVVTTRTPLLANARESCV